MAETTRYCWSRNEESYHGDCASREDAAAEAMEDLANDLEPGEVAVFWTATVLSGPHFLQPDGWYAKTIGEDVTESIDCWLSENDIATEDEPVMELSKDRQLELGNLILAFLREHGQFNRYGIGEAQKHTEVMPAAGVGASGQQTVSQKHQGVNE